MKLRSPNLFRNVPALVIGYRRPDAIAKVLRSVRANLSGPVYVFVDRPREDTDSYQCSNVVTAARSVIPDAHIFRPTQHRGCKLGVVEAISTFLNQTECGFILEDDCVPSPGFFSFVGTYLLDAPRFSDEHNIMMVSGRNECGQSATRRPWLLGVGEIWGWGTWAEKWSFMDLEVGIPGASDMSNLSRTISREQPKKWLETCEGVTAAQNQVLDTWDYQWALSRWQRDGLALVPQRNLVTNIGFGRDATHTQRQQKEPRRYRRAVSRSRDVIDYDFDSATLDVQYLRGECNSK